MTEIIVKIKCDTEISIFHIQQALKESFPSASWKVEEVKDDRNAL
jgi:hypothetical protein